MSQTQNLTQGQTLRQEQILAPQQIQSLEILTVPLMELENKIEEELISNPVIELEEPDASAADGKHAAESEELEDPAEPLPAYTQQRLNFGDVPDETGDPMDSNREDFAESLERFLEDGSGPWNELVSSYDDGNYDLGGDRREAYDRRQHFFDSIVAESSLQEELLEQLRLSDVPEELRIPAEEIIGSIDGGGYLKTPLADIAQSTGIPMQAVERALKLVQSFDPPGIGARDLKESLLLQLKRQGRENSPLAELVREHFDLIVRNKLPQIAKEMNISMEELNGLLLELRRLSPYPASSITSEAPVYVIPEVTVEPDGDEFKVIPNKEYNPRIVISGQYVKMLEDPEVSEEAKSYIRKKIAAGKLLIRALEQRKSTIVRIAELIVSMQHDFLKNGPAFLKPMTMQYIAERIGLHEATVSRAIANKYMETPMGLFEFKYFFTGGFRSENGEELSSRGIKEIIKEVIDSENPASPLSDSKIMAILKERGFDVARRTIAKYREELGIQSSQMRKVY